MSITAQRAWYKKTNTPLPPHLISQKQITKIDLTRTKEAMKMGLKAHGATKGLPVGAPDGSWAKSGSQKHGDVKVWSQAEIDQENRKRGTEPQEISPKERRLAIIKASLEKAKRKKAGQFDVPTARPQELDSRDLTDMHNALHIPRGSSSMDEEVEQVDESKIAPLLRAMQDSRYHPEIGHRIITIRGGQNTGTVERIKGPHVVFKSDHPKPGLDGEEYFPTYKTHISNVRKLEESEQVDEVRQLNDFDRFYFSSIPPGPGLDDFQKRSMQMRGQQILEPGHKVRIARSPSSSGRWDGHTAKIVSSHGDNHVVQTDRGEHALLVHSSDLRRMDENKLDAVGKEDSDINNDGSTNRTDAYLHNKRKAVRTAILNKLKTGK
jgi:hypothetical protein